MMKMIGMLAMDDWNEPDEMSYDTRTATLSKANRTSRTALLRGKMELQLIRGVRYFCSRRF